MDDYKKFEVKRQFVHLTLGMFTAFLVFYLDKVFVLGLIAAAVTVMVFSPENKFFRFLLNEFERDGKKFNGAILKSSDFKSFEQTIVSEMIFFALGVVFPILLVDKMTCVGIIAVFFFRRLCEHNNREIFRQA